MSAATLSYDGEAVDRAFRDLMLQLQEQKKRQKMSLRAMEEKSSCHHESLVSWIKMERQPYLSGLARAFACLGMELWIVPKAYCRWPLKPLRVEPWKTDFQPAFADYLIDAFAAVRLPYYRVREHLPIGRNVVYTWLDGSSQPKALTLFRVLNLVGYTMEVRESPHPSR